MPGWFPFALLASGLIALGSGMVANWRTNADQPKPPPQPPGPPPLKQAGILKDWATGDYRV